jgi:hypothetical protein
MPLPLAELYGDVLFGNESLLVEVTSSDSAILGYNLLATYIEGDCGNGALEPNEECEPDESPLGQLCNPITCRFDPPDNDLCFTAETAALPADGTPVVFTGNTETASDAGDASCQASQAGTNDADVWYAFTAPADGLVVADLIPDGWAGALSASTGVCSGLTEVACQSGTGANTRRSVEFNVAQDNTFFIEVDSYNSGVGNFELRTAFLVTPANDICDDAQSIAGLPTDGTRVVINGDTRAAADNATADDASCQTSAGHQDVHYTFNAPASGRLVAQVSTPDWSPVLYAHEGVGCGLTALGCDAAELELDVTAGADYTLSVDGSGGNEQGPFTLELFYVAPPPNDLCQDAELVTVPPVGQTAVIVADSRGASDTVGGTCQDGATDDDRDAFYRILASDEGTVDVVVTSDRFDPALIAFDTCGGSEVACGASPSFLSFDVPLGGGSYLVAVDAETAGGGEYTLQVRYNTDPGDLTMPIDVALPLVDLPIELTPAGDVDCYRFSTGGGELYAITDNVAGTCSGNDTELWLYEDGETDPDEEIARNDDAFGNPDVNSLCSLIETTLEAGTYVLCVEHYSRFSPQEITGGLLSVSID